MPASPNSAQPNQHQLKELSMNIIRTFTAEDLGKTMPAIAELEVISAAQHCDNFYALDTTDVWTADGWLVTAVQDDGVTHHLRKGADVVVAKLTPETPLYFKHTPKSRRLLAL
jgi:hypothetical protein